MVQKKSCSYIDCLGILGFEENSMKHLGLVEEWGLMMMREYAYRLRPMISQ